MILSFYGGGFATVPAYLRDLFGTFQVGAIHGRLLTAWSAAGVAGPLIVNAFLDAQGKPGKLTAAAYRPALFTMVGVLAVGFVANLLIRPVTERFHEPDDARRRRWHRHDRTHRGRLAAGGGAARLRTGRDHPQGGDPLHRLSLTPSRGHAAAARPARLR